MLKHPKVSVESSTEEQIARASTCFDEALMSWNWEGNDSVKHLF